MMRTWRVGLPILALSALKGCATEPTVEEVAGDYAAVVFTATEGGETMDILSQGAVLEIALAVGGTTTGRLFVPGGGEDPGTDFEADLTGTWTLSGDTVEFSHDADTFVRDTAFEVQGNDLVANPVFSSVSLEVVLRKQG